MSNMVTEALAGRAPRILAGCEAVQNVLSDGEWHDYEEAFTAISETGLADATVRNVLRDARYGEHVEFRNVAPAGSGKYRWEYRHAVR